VSNSSNSSNSSKDSTYHSKYYLANKEKLKAKARKNYKDNREDRLEKAKGYRKTKSFKSSKRKSDIKRIEENAFLSKRSAELGILGRPYTLEEDKTIMLYKTHYKSTNKFIAEILDRSIKGIEYRYSLLKKKAKDEKNQ